VSHILNANVATPLAFYFENLVLGSHHQKKETRVLGVRDNQNWDCSKDFFSVQYELIIQVKYQIVCFLCGRNELLRYISEQHCSQDKGKTQTVCCMFRRNSAHAESNLWPLLEYGT
jgi:hypothetical protein